MISNMAGDLNEIENAFRPFLSGKQNILKHTKVLMAGRHVPTECRD